MIINFRYHIFTITAIFAALGIGILIGSSIIGNEGLLEEQQRIVREISNDIDRMKDENTRLLKSISSLEANLDYKKNRRATISFTLRGQNGRKKVFTVQ